MRTLNTLPPKCRAVLAAPSQTTPTVVRLLEMGMTPGTPVVVTRRAPLGDPLEISLRGTRLCLRGADAALFGVTDVEGPG